MKRFALLALVSLSACVLEEGVEDELGEVESEAATTGPTVTELPNYNAVTISGTPNSVRYFKIEVPAGYDHISALRDGPLYVGAHIFMKRGQLPTPSNYDCRRLDGSRSGCKLDYPAAGTYYIAVYGTGTYGYTNMALRAYYRNTYSPLGNNASIPLWNQYGYDMFFKLDVPSGAGSATFEFTLAPEDDGAVDLVVNHGAFATETAFDCKREIDWNLWTVTGSCTFTNPAPGTYYIGLLAHTSYEATFEARYSWVMAPPTTTIAKD